ncbi:hypothetical protein AC578_9825 [Pseudocercospora eumusae]|uniref:Uncharacterized protein n=1 Tax=Pseudocercospora eumusae TaxID=321146 RepID=A0A139H9M4_9PEZI|nr:hypothetical protein AC578_9825 [Pseudocercospora eumusae]
MNICIGQALREKSKAASKGPDISWRDEIAYEDDELSVAVNGKRTNLGVNQDLQRANQEVFFKAGN